MSSEILEKIASKGSNGIKRIQLKRAFGKKCDDILQSLIENKDVIMEKKGNVYFVWTKDNHALYSSQKDSELKPVSDMVKTVNSTKVHLNDIKTMKNMQQNNTYDNFKMEFDKYLSESSTSIGWAPFSQIRKRICEARDLSNERFYMLASELVEQHRENYEISSGGQEGIMVRGLIHGFVRNV